MSDQPEEIVVPVHFILPTTDEEWFLATYFDFGALFRVLGLWKATLPQFGGGIYATGSIDLWQLTRPRYKGCVMLDTTWTPQSLATIERRLKQERYRPRQEVQRLY
ncbi:MAG: hypothetical protein KF716_20100 [Anaerolineae bacterium]|nr:hypothetical protein [Anaerolineae bacterium]